MTPLEIYIIKNEFVQYILLTITWAQTHHTTKLKCNALLYATRYLFIEDSACTCVTFKEPSPSSIFNDDMSEIEIFPLKEQQLD